MNTEPICHARNAKAPSIEYRAWVNGKEVYVFNHLGFSGGTMSWIFFDMAQPVEIRVRPHRLVDTARVLPRRAGISAHLEENTISFQVPETGTYFVEWDDELELPFFVFARPQETPPPSGRRVISFGPGEHQAGLIELQSGDHLHLAAGAEVYGAIRAVDASDLSITGRGILNQSHLPFGGRDNQRHPLEMIRCSNILIDGPLFLEGCTWNLVFRDCDHVEVRDVGVLSERPYSTDGINPCDSRHVHIHRCFVRSKDDCISIKGMQRNTPDEALKPIHGIRVTDCLFWSDNNNGLVVGTETWASEIHDIVFERTDFVKISGTCGDWAAAFAVQALFDTTISDIRFQDIDVECCTGNPFSVIYLDEVYGIPGERREQGGLIRDLVFKDIRFHRKPRRRSLIQGRDDTRTIQQVSFENVTFGGTSITSAADLRLVSNAFVKGVRFSGRALV